LAGFALERDERDELRFVPIQTPLAQELCSQYNEPADVSTAIYIDDRGSHTHSTAVLRMLLHLPYYYRYLATLALWIIPAFVRDAVYKQVAKNRGKIWKGIKKVTGMGDTSMVKYREYVLGLDTVVVSGGMDGWGFDSNDDDNNNDNAHAASDDDDDHTNLDVMDSKERRPLMQQQPQQRFHKDDDKCK
jgi:predicted DCC family thiol-disulfide oxidoreductase YuxK